MSVMISVNYVIKAKDRICFEKIKKVFEENRFEELKNKNQYVEYMVENYQTDEENLKIIYEDDSFANPEASEMFLEVLKIISQDNSLAFSANLNMHCDDGEYYDRKMKFDCKKGILKVTKDKVKAWDEYQGWIED